MGKGEDVKATILKKFADDTKWGAVVETAQDMAYTVIENQNIVVHAPLFPVHWEWYQ